MIYIYQLCVENIYVKVKVKFLPITGHEGPEGEYRYNTTPSLTSGIDWGGWSTSPTAALPLRKDAVQIV